MPLITINDKFNNKICRNILIEQQTFIKQLPTEANYRVVSIDAPDIDSKNSKARYRSAT